MASAKVGWWGNSLVGKKVKKRKAPACSGHAGTCAPGGHFLFRC